MPARIGCAKRPAGHRWRATPLRSAAVRYRPTRLGIDAEGGCGCCYPPVAPVMLGRVERRVAACDPVRARFAGSEMGHPDRERDPAEALAPILQLYAARTDELAQAVGQGRGIDQPGGGQDHGELLAAV